MDVKKIYKLLEQTNFIETDDVRKICKDAIQNDDIELLCKIVNKVHEYYNDKHIFQFLQNVVIPMCMKYDKYDLIYKIIPECDDINIENEIKYTIRHLIDISDVETLQKLFITDTNFDKIITNEYINDVLLTMKKVEEDEMIKEIMLKYIADRRDLDKKTCNIL